MLIDKLLLYSEIFLKLNKETFSSILSSFLRNSSWGFAQIFGAKSVILFTVHEYSAAVIFQIA
jgi:hypothetical protein